MHVLSSKNIPSAKLVIDQEPEEDSMLWLTVAFLKPFEDRMNLMMPKQQFIDFG